MYENDPMLPVTLRPTDQVVFLMGTPVRVWKGTFADGTPTLFYVLTFGVPDEASNKVNGFALAKVDVQLNNVDPTSN